MRLRHIILIFVLVGLLTSSCGGEWVIGTPTPEAATWTTEPIITIIPLVTVTPTVLSTPEITPETTPKAIPE